ncbi:hypothetical protein [Laceyella putida]|jgi:hypothetical protein|uniref:Uncharacterized protein n=1 Tax=Laceyella putida TaxID=110101 RepID=A0ABW2RJF5_9BACL
MKQWQWLAVRWKEKTGTEDAKKPQDPPDVVTEGDQPPPGGMPVED